MADPTNVTGLLRRWRADTIAQSNSTAVTSWAASVGGAALAQGVGGNRPLYITSGINGLPVVRFATDDYLDATITDRAQPLTWVIVADLASAATTQEVVQTQAEVLFLATPDGWSLYAGGATAPPSNIVTTTPVVATAVFTGGTGTIFTDGTSRATGAVGTQGTSTFMRVGNHSGISRPLNGDIAEILLYDHALTTGERAEVHIYVQDRYGITVSDDPTASSRVAVTTGAPGSAAAFSPTLPTHTTSDRLILAVVGKDQTTTIPTINQSWVLLKSGTGGTGTTANDTGQTFWAIYGKDATSSSETAPTVTPGATAPNSWEWICASHRPGTGMAWRDAIGTSAAWVQSASDTTTASPLTGTAGAWTGVQPTAKDAIFAVGVIPTDLGTALGATTITATGLTGGTKDTATSQYIENPFGNDTAAVWAGWTGFTGTASAGLALSFTVTGATNQSGSLIAVALRQQTGATSLTVADARQLQATDPVTLTQHHAATVADARQLQATDPVALTQHHVVAVQDARQVPAIDNVTVTAHPPSVALTVNDARQLQTTDPIALVQHRVLTAADARQLQATDAVALTQHNALAVQDARQLQATDPIALTQHRVLAVQDARQLQSSDPVALTQHRVLAVNDTRQTQSSESPALTQHRILAVQDAQQLQATDAVAVTYHPPGAVTLTVADTRQTQTVDPATLTQHHVLAVADTRQLQATDPIALVQHRVLAVSDARQLQASDPVTVAYHPPGAIVLTVQDAAQTQTAGGLYKDEYSDSYTLNLTQHHVLAPQDARQLHTADQPTLTQHRVLAVQDARQLQATDAVAVTYHPPGAIVLTVNDARQLQATDPINLTQHAALTVNDARQTQTADSPAVTPSKITLTVNDAKQTPTVDSPALTQHHLLTVADTRHNHPADNPALTQHHLLTTQDARQLQKVGNVTFGRPPHITHPNLAVQTNQSTLHTPTGSTLLLTPHRPTLHTPTTTGTLLLDDDRHTLNLEG